MLKEGTAGQPPLRDFPAEDRKGSFRPLALVLALIAASYRFNLNDER